MNILHRSVVGGLMAALVLLSTGASLAATVVNVTLWDKGAAMTMATDLAYASPPPDLSAATMGIRALPATAKAGVVTFKVTNSSTDTIHEMLVIALADPTKPLPYVAADSRVDEEAAGDKGEVSELDPGASGSLTLSLAPGHYLLICNVAGHFAAGMWATFEVTN